MVREARDPDLDLDLSGVDDRNGGLGSINGRDSVEVLPGTDDELMLVKTPWSGEDG